MERLQSLPLSSRHLWDRFRAIFLGSDPLSQESKPLETETEGKDPWEISPGEVLAHVPDGPAKVAAQEVMAIVEKHPVRIYRAGGGIRIVADREWKRANPEKWKRFVGLFWFHSFEVVADYFWWLLPEWEAEAGAL